MPTYYVEDYDGERNDDAVERVVIKVIAPEDDAPTPKKTTRAEKK